MFFAFLTDPLLMIGFLYHSFYCQDPFSCIKPIRNLTVMNPNSPENKKPKNLQNVIFNFRHYTKSWVWTWKASKPNIWIKCKIGQVQVIAYNLLQVERLKGTESKHNRLTP